MTQAKVKLASFEEYLAYSDETPLDGRYELIDGELVELPPESRLNSTVAIRVLLALLAAGIGVELIHLVNARCKFRSCSLVMPRIATLIWWCFGLNIWR